MKAKKVHLRENARNLRWSFSKYHFDDRVCDEQLTEDPEKVTCKRCLRAMERKGTK